jgi:hypothetical protein
LFGLLLLWQLISPIPGGSSLRPFRLAHLGEYI